MEFSLLCLKPRETWSLRHPVLRAGRPLEECHMDGDDDPDTRHFGFRDEAGALVAVVSYMRRPTPHGQEAGFQLRGMAVAEVRQGQGVGGQLLRASQRALSEEMGGEEGKVRIWCNARVGAKGFYERHGFSTVEGPFDIPKVGPHYLMEFS